MNPSASHAPGAPTLRRNVRFGLRKQTLLIVLCLGFLPSLLTLLVSTTYAIRAIRGYAIDQAQNLLVVQADRLGEQLQAEAEKLQRLAMDSEFLALYESPPDGEPPPAPAFFHQRLMSSLGGLDAIVYLFGPDGPRSALGVNGLESSIQFPDRNAVRIIRNTIASRPQEDLFAFEVPKEAGGTFWAAARAGKGKNLWLVSRLDLPFDEIVAQLSRFLDEEVFLLSSISGPLGRTGSAPKETDFFLTHPELFRTSAAVIEASNEDSAVYTSVRVGAMSALSRPTGGDSALVLVRRVELDTPLVALLYGFWQIALYGLIFIGLVGAFGLWLSNRLVHPIIRLRAGFLRLEQGDLDYRINLRTGDEMEELAASMNQMAATLQETYQNLAWKLLELDEKAKQLTISSDIAQAINRSLDMEALFKEIINSIRLLVPADALIVCTVPEGRNHIDVAYVYPHTLRMRLPQGTSFDLEASFSGECVDRHVVKIFPLDANGTHAEEELLRGEELTTLCVLPLRTQTGPVGVLLLADATSEAFRPEEIDILKLVSPSLATALEHSRLYEQQSQFASELERQVLERTKALQRVQEQLMQAEKLATTGEIAAKVAHEINNPLSIIKNYLKLLQVNFLREQETHGEMESARAGFQIIGEEIDRIARIVAKLRHVSSPANANISEVDVNNEIAVLVQLFRETFREKTLVLETICDPYLQDARLSRDSLRQILMNLLRNAYDATDSSGKISIETIAHEPTEERFTIKVRDTGHGIAPENMARIFDPFFTTKREEKGTGLGLSVSYGLARTMGGSLEVRTPANGGAEFVLNLPITAPEERKEQTHVIRKDGERIIIG